MKTDDGKREERRRRQDCTSAWFPRADAEKNICLSKGRLDQELRKLCFPPNILTVINSRSMSWVCVAGASPLISSRTFLSNLVMVEIIPKYSHA